MRKLMTTASLAAVLMAGPALAASDMTTNSTGSDPARTGSAAVSGSATGGGAATSNMTSGELKTGAKDAEMSVTGADAARTGSAAVEGSATGGGKQASEPNAKPMGSTADTSSTPGATAVGTGADRTGSKAVQGSATGAGKEGVAATGAAGTSTMANKAYDQGELHALIGKDVTNSAGDDIGEVNDVVMVDGRPVLIVGVGGFLGIGEKEVTVPYDEATMSSDGLMVPMTKDQLKTQPAYNADATAGVSVKDTYKK